MVGELEMLPGHCLFVAQTLDATGLWERRREEGRGSTGDVRMQLMATKAALYVCVNWMLPFGVRQPTRSIGASFFIKRTPNNL